MTQPDPGVALDPLFEEGLDWLSRIGSGAFSAEERAAFTRWRATSSEHEAAFRRAAALGHVLRRASRRILDEEASASVVVPFRTSPVVQPRRFDRRAVITGAIAASVAGVVVVGSSGLPSLLARRPDYSTGTGERKTIALATGLTVDLDAQSSIAVNHDQGRPQIELISGRTAIDAQLAISGIEVIARKGRVFAKMARFAVETDADRSCVTCVSGVVTLLFGDDRLQIPERQQIVYADDRIELPMPVDTADVTAWTTGQLVFRHTPLAEVIRQVNRYRPGKIVIASGALRRRPVSGVFHIAQIDDAVGQIQQITGARILHVPGGVVLFS